jgi:CMP-N,N'-diacetyllegionaminic acid synthase
MSEKMTAPKVIAFIPARGGSKRIPGKNLKDLGGKPLLRYAVDAALESGVFDEVIVSSDDETVAQLVEGWFDITFHQRDPALADDFSRVPEVAHAYLKDLPESVRPDVIGVLLPPCPFRTGTHVREAYEKFQAENPEGFLVSVTKYEFPPQFALRWSDDTNRGLEMVSPEVYQMTTRSQSVEPLWHPNGAMYFCSVEAFLKTASFFSDPLTGYEMPPEDSLDLDWPHQFEMAEVLMKQRNS